MSKRPEPGERVLVEAEYDFCYGESAWVTTLYEDAMPYEGASMNVALRHIHPAPRGGEYRLTVDELVTLCYDSENYPYFEDDEERTNFVKQWLANRKEEV